MGRVCVEVELAEEVREEVELTEEVELAKDRGRGNQNSGLNQQEYHVPSTAASREV